MKATKTTRFCCNNSKNQFVELVEGKEPDLEDVDKKHVNRMVELGLLSDKPQKPAATENKSAEGADEVKLASLKKDDLIALAAEKQIEIDPNANKDVIIAAIEAAQAA